MTVDTLHIVLGALFLLAVGAAVWIQMRSRPDARLAVELDAAKSDTAELRGERDAARARAEAAEQKIAAMAAQIEERERSLAREREQTAKLQTDSEARFKALAENVLVDSQKKFVELADETLKKHKEGAKGELGALIEPIKESFGQFQQKIGEIEKVRAEDRAQLTEQIKALGETSSQTRAAAAKLAVALSAPRHGGRWGEETLRNVLELAGLSPYADFEEQVSHDSEKGKLRPDVVVRMPGGRRLVIDSKVSLDDYLAASGETDPRRRNELLAAHAARVKAHVTALSRKDYWNSLPDRVDFVAMFIPGENFYAAVLEHDREIFDYASRNNVIIVTPSTLVALAKSVAYGWRQEQMAANAERAAALGRDLYDRLARMVEHMGRVGGGLGNAVKSYNEMVGSFESRVLPSARKFEELQIADPSRKIAETPQIELAPRAPQAVEGAKPSTPQLFADAETGADASKRKLKG